MSHIKIQPDNLTKRQKKLTYLLIVILLIITAVFWGIIKRTSNYELAIRNGKDFTNIECEIIGYKAKFNSSVFKYKYHGKEYKSSQHFTDELQIGEMYQGRLNKHQPEVAIMLLNEPAIDTTEYKTAIARIIEIEPQTDELNRVTYSYEIIDKKYIRTEFISRVFKWGIGDKVSVLYKIDNPKISYIEKKKQVVTICNMAGGGFSGLTRQTNVATSCGSDRIYLRNPARPHTSDRYQQSSLFPGRN